MAHFALLWKARTIEKYRLDYEREKLYSIAQSNAEMPKRSFFQRLRHFKYDSKKRMGKHFRRIFPEGSAISNLLVYLRTDQTFPNFVLKSVLGFVGGIVLTYLFFMFFVFQLSISLMHATIMSSIIGVMLTLGLAFSYRIRCLVFLLFPQFFSRVGRYTLTCYALVLILTGPATNTLKNSEVLSESMACGQEQIKTSVRQVTDAVKKPFNSMKDSIKKMIDKVRQVAVKLKETLLKIHRLVMSIVKVLQSAFSWLGSVVGMCNKKLGTPFERCTRALGDSVLDCRAKLGPYFSWLCNVVYVAHAACWAVRPLNVICIIVEFFKGTIVGTVKKKLRTFSNHVKTMLYVSVHVHHSYSFSSNASRSASQVAAGIVTEIRHRADPLITWLAWSSCVTSAFLLLIILRAKYYQHMFETRSRYDNRYVTKELRDLDLRRAKQGRETVLPLNRRERAKYITTTSFRLVASEKLYLSRSVVFMAITTFKLLIHMVADYSLYWILMTIRLHGRFQSPLKAGPPDAGVQVSGEGPVAGMVKSLVESLSVPIATPAPSPVSCLPDPFPPDTQRYAQIGVLIFLLWFFALFEPYGLRLRHVIMGHYRPERAKARAVWLYNHILRTRGGFLKFARRKLHRDYKYSTEEKFTFKQWLDAHLPFWWLRSLLGTIPKEPHCMLCYTVERADDPDTQLIRCETPGCPGIYCASCFQDIGQLCTICMSPVDYGDLSDVSLEKGSSEESQNSDQDTEDESKPAMPEDYHKDEPSPPSPDPDDSDTSSLHKEKKEGRWKIFKKKKKKTNTHEEVPLLRYSEKRKSFHHNDLSQRNGIELLIREHKQVVKRSLIQKRCTNFEVWSVTVPNIYPFQRKISQDTITYQDNIETERKGNYHSEMKTKTYDTESQRHFKLLLKSIMPFKRSKKKIKPVRHKYMKSGETFKLMAKIMSIHKFIKVRKSKGKFKLYRKRLKRFSKIWRNVIRRNRKIFLNSPLHGKRIKQHHQTNFLEIKKSGHYVNLYHVRKTTKLSLRLRNKWRKVLYNNKNKKETTNYANCLINHCPLKVNMKDFTSNKCYNKDLRAKFIKELDVTEYIQPFHKTGKNKNMKRNIVTKMQAATYRGNGKSKQKEKIRPTDTKRNGKRSKKNNCDCNDKINKGIKIDMNKADSKSSFSIFKLDDWQERLSKIKGPKEIWRCFVSNLTSDDSIDCEVGYSKRKKRHKGDDINPIESKKNEEDEARRYRLSSYLQQEQDWIKKEYHKEIGVKQVDIDNNNELDEALKELEMKSQKRKVKARLHVGKLDGTVKPGEATDIKWQVAPSAKKCACPLKRCICRGVAPELLKKGKIPKKLHPHKSSMNQVRQILGWKVKVPPPSGTLISRLASAVDSEQERYLQMEKSGKLKVQGPEFCLSRCLNFYGPERDIEFEVPDERLEDNDKQNQLRINEAGNSKEPKTTEHRVFFHEADVRANPLRMAAGTLQIKRMEASFQDLREDLNDCHDSVSQTSVSSECFECTTSEFKRPTLVDNGDDLIRLRLEDCRNPRYQKSVLCLRRYCNRMLGREKNVCCHHGTGDTSTHKTSYQEPRDQYLKDLANQTPEQETSKPNEVKLDIPCPEPPKHQQNHPLTIKEKQSAGVQAETNVPLTSGCCQYNDGRGCCGSKCTEEKNKTQRRKQRGPVCILKQLLNFEKPVSLIDVGVTASPEAFERSCQVTVKRRNASTQCDITIELINVKCQCVADMRENYNQYKPSQDSSPPALRGNCRPCANCDGATSTEVPKCTCASQYVRGIKFSASPLKETCCTNDPNEISNETDQPSEDSESDCNSNSCCTTICSRMTVEYINEAPARLRAESKQKDNRFIAKANRFTETDDPTVCDASTVTDWWSPIMSTRKTPDAIALEKKKGGCAIRRSLHDKRLKRNRLTATDGRIVTFNSKTQVISRGGGILTPSRYLLESQKHYNELFSTYKPHRAASPFEGHKQESDIWFLNKSQKSRLINKPPILRSKKAPMV